MPAGSAQRAGRSCRAPPGPSTARWGSPACRLRRTTVTNWPNSGWCAAATRTRSTWRGYDRSVWWLDVHELEEQVRRLRLERQVAQLVHDQQPRLSEERQPLLQPAARVRLGERGDERGGGDEQDRVALPDRLVAQRHRQVRLADPRRPQQQDRPGVGDEAGGCQLAHLPGVERGLGREVEAPQVARERRGNARDQGLNPGRLTG